MAYTLKHGRSIESEVQRIADKKLALAIANLHGIGDRKSDEAIHEARRHIKKVRALIRLVQPALGRRYHAANERLRDVNRLLAPIADGEAVVQTLARLGKRYRSELPRQSRLAIQRGLVRRWQQLDEQAKADQVLRRSMALLRAQRSQLPQWQLDAGGFAAIGHGLRKSVRGARRAMRRALAHPTIDNCHAWRRRVKDHWLQVRLLEGRCGNELMDLQRALEALDGYLGEYHNAALLQQVLLSDGLLPRADTARSLRLLRRYGRELRQQAEHLGMPVYSETPRAFVKRVKRLWRSARQASPAATRVSWPHAA